MRIGSFLVLLALSTTSAVEAFPSVGPAELAQYPFYFGLGVGYGATTWGGLVPERRNSTPAMLLATPIDTSENGTSWMVFAGYELNHHFSVEGKYERYPTARIIFDGENSLYSYYHNGSTFFSSQTESVGLMGKLLMDIPSTPLRAYSTFGIAGVHRSDTLLNRWNLGPTFGVGVNYPFDKHWMGEFGFTYTGGNGESEQTPCDDYTPFIYGAFFKIAYRF